jgi:hypothetical protein
MLCYYSLEEIYDQYRDLLLLLAGTMVVKFARACSLVMLEFAILDLEVGSWLMS